MRQLAGLAALVILTAAIVTPQILASPSETETPVVAAQAADTLVAEVETTTSTTAAPSTTVEPPETTTSEQSTTTSTESPATTALPLPPSTSSTTTTTAPKVVSSGKLVIPATLPYPAGQMPFADGGGYSIMGGCIDTEDVNCADANWFDFSYWGHGLPYLYNDNGSDGAWWLAGDRGAYSYAYGFLQTGEHIHATDSFINEEIIARFTVIRSEEGEYARVNDNAMDEGVRLYNGALAPSGSSKELKECAKPLEAGCITPGVDYSKACDLPAWTGRVGLFTSAGEIVDIRDFSKPSSGSHRHAHSVNYLAPGKFVLIDFNGSRASIGWCPDAHQGLGLHIYYDRMGSGKIAVEN